MAGGVHRSSTLAVPGLSIRLAGNSARTVAFVWKSELIMCERADDIVCRHRRILRSHSVKPSAIVYIIKVGQAT